MRQMFTVNQQILAAIKFGVSQNKVIWRLLNLGVFPRPVYAVCDRRICWRRQILAKTRNSPNIIARQNLLIYSIYNMVFHIFKIHQCITIYDELEHTNGHKSVTKLKILKVLHGTPEKSYRPIYRCIMLMWIHGCICDCNLISFILQQRVYLTLPGHGMHGVNTFTRRTT